MPKGIRRDVQSGFYSMKEHALRPIGDAQAIMTAMMTLYHQYIYIGPGEVPLYTYQATVISDCLTRAPFPNACNQAEAHKHGGWT